MIRSIRICSRENGDVPARKVPELARTLLIRYAQPTSDELRTMAMLNICLSWMWSRSQQHWAIQRCSFTSPEDRSDAASSSSSRDDRTLRVGKDTWMMEPSVYDSYCAASYCMNYSINSFFKFKEWKAVINVQVMICINVFTIDSILSS